MKRRGLVGITAFMSRAHRLINLAGVFLPFAGFVVAIVLLWDRWVDWSALAVLALMYVAHRPRRDARVPPAADPPLVPDLQGGPVRVRRARLDGRAGPGHVVGGRPPQAPRAHRPGRRPAHAARARRRPQGRRRRPLVRAHGLAVRPRRAGGARSATRATSRGPRHAASSTARSASGCWPASRCRPRSATRSPARCARRARGRAVGRRRADLPAAPRHLVDQLGLPLLRHAAASPSTTTRPTSSGSPPLSIGESWHHNHHAFPRSAFHGLAAGRSTRPAWVIRRMRRRRLAWNVVEITPERQAQKLVRASRSPRIPPRRRIATHDAA